jgi:hypothetical protein
MKNDKKNIEKQLTLNDAKVESKIKVDGETAKEMSEVLNVVPCFFAILLGLQELAVTLKENTLIFSNMLLSENINRICEGKFKNVVLPETKFLKTSIGAPVNAHLVYKRFVPTKKGLTCEVRNVKTGEGYISYISDYGLFFHVLEIDFSKSKELIIGTLSKTLPNGAKS